MVGYIIKSIYLTGDVPSLGAKMLELPYENSSVSMFLLLPNDITTDSITANLTQQTLRDAIGLMSKETVQVSLPRFNMTTKIERELKQVSFFRCFGSNISMMVTANGGFVINNIKE